MNSLTFFRVCKFRKFLSLLCLLSIWTLPWISSCALESVASSDTRRAVTRTKHISDIYPQVACVNKVLRGEEYSHCWWSDMTASDRMEMHRKKPLKPKKEAPRTHLQLTICNVLECLTIKNVFVRINPHCLVLQCLKMKT